MKEKYLRPNIVGAEMVEGAIPFIVGAALAGYAATKVADFATSAVMAAPHLTKAVVNPRPKTKLQSLTNKKFS